MKIKKILVQMLYALGFFHIYIKSIAYFSRNKKPEFDIVYAVAGKGWVLEGWCRDINEQLQRNSAFYYTDNHIPSAKVYYISDYGKFFTLLFKNPHILNHKIIVQYTHYNPDRYLSDKQLAQTFNLASAVYTMNEATRKKLIKDGVRPDIITTRYAGIDPHLFYPSKIDARKNRPVIGFNLLYQPKKLYSDRKNHDTIIDIIKQVDFCDVILLGKGWQGYGRFTEVKDLPHFTYVESSYREYQKYYAKMDVFVSVSKLEGGPVPMLEAMFCNVFPVVSNTGFAPDLITDGENGILFDVDLPPNKIIEKIKEGIEKSKNKEVASSVNYLTWKKFAENFEDLLLSIHD